MPLLWVAVSPAGTLVPLVSATQLGLLALLGRSEQEQVAFARRSPANLFADWSHRDFHDNIVRQMTSPHLRADNAIKPAVLW
jgi:hypothetical protein